MSIRTPSEHLVEAAETRGVAFVFLADGESEAVRANVRARFVAGRGPRRWMWENLGQHASVQNPDGWMLLDAYLCGQPFIVLFDEFEDRRMIAFPAGTKLAPLLAECPGFEFYVTDRPVSYLVCFNHHDFLVAAGAAVEWLVRLDRQLAG